MLTFIFLLSACRTANVIDSPNDFAKTIRKANRQKQPFLMFSGVDTFVVTHIMVENRRRDITVQLNRLDSARRMQLLSPASSLPKQYLLYMRDSTSYTLDEPHTIPTTRIDRIQVKQ